MPILWLVVAGAMLIAYVYFEWTIVNRTAKGLMQQERVEFPGKKRNYILLAATISFVGMSALYFAMITYFGAKVQIGCWLGISALVSLIVALGTFGRLRYATFQNDSERQE